jgi:hypothetical protein
VSPGPYVVMTKRFEPYGSSPDDGGRTRLLSTVAVATLEDRAALIDAGVPPFSEVLDAVQAGETRIEARNGTVIEVEPTTWYALTERAGITDYNITAARAWDGNVEAQQRIFDAFNAQEAKRA